jgi:hypothetical protein
VWELKGKIQVYDIDARKTRFLTDGPNPSWSPDGKWIAFRTASELAMMMSPETGEQRSLFNGRQIVGPINWSPDSEYLLYGTPHFGFANQVESIWNLADVNYRMIVHRLRDGAEIDARSAVPAGIVAKHFWVSR